MTDSTENKNNTDNNESIEAVEETVEERIMKGLKDFQKETVCRIAERYEEGKKKIMVSDEVGLGKTIIAKGVVAKLAEKHFVVEKRSRPFRVVYVCSNGAIADQNLNKLCISSNSHKDDIGHSRLSMQHLNIFKRNKKTASEVGAIHLIPLTPATSFKIEDRAGTAPERALMFAILKEVLKEILKENPDLKKYKSELDVLLQQSATKGWENCKDKYLQIVKDAGSDYIGDMKGTVLALPKKEENGESVLAMLIERCSPQNTDEKQLNDNELIEKLRQIFVHISIGMLTPEIDGNAGEVSERAFMFSVLKEFIAKKRHKGLYELLKPDDESNWEGYEKACSEKLNALFSEFVKISVYRSLTKKENGKSVLDMLIERCSPQNTAEKQLNDNEFIEKLRQIFVPETDKGVGNVQERALMFTVLKEIPGLKGCESELEALLKQSANNMWEKHKKAYSEKLNALFSEFVKISVYRSLTKKENGKSVLDMLIERCSTQNTAEKQLNDNELIEKLRQIFVPETDKGAGNVRERALMFTVLKEIPELKGCESELEVLLKRSANNMWEKHKEDYSENKKLLNRFKEEVEALLTETKEGDKSVLDMLIKICNKRLNDKELIGKLRQIFAQISIKMLEPDLVIMDEFQRFKDLLHDNDSITVMLVNELLKKSNTKVLLLSATPYKLYSTLDEIDSNNPEEYYKEFLDVMKFLEDEGIAKENTQADQTQKSEAKDSFKTIWGEYSEALKKLTENPEALETAKKAKRKAEDAMYEHVCRTERISEKNMADIIDDSGAKKTLDISVKDVSSYIQIQQLLKEIGLSDMKIDYVKSTPYVLSFMNDYKEKKNIVDYFSGKNSEEDFKKLDKDTFWLNYDKIKNYEELPWNNARLIRVKEQTFKDNAAMLLWVPPSRPYYEPKGVYEKEKVGDFSKTIIFSQWAMVPRMLAGLLSYEAERLTSGTLGKEKSKNEAERRTSGTPGEEKSTKYFYTSENRYPSSRLSFTVDKKKTKDGKDTPAAMTLFCLVYPSKFLASCYNPIDCMNENMSLEDIKKQIKKQIKEKIEEKIEEKLKEISNNTSQKEDAQKEDARWYYLAPLLLDNENYVGKPDDENYVGKWLDRIGKGEEKDKNTAFSAHLEKLKKLFEGFNNGNVKLGKQPEDLADVLVEMAIASPAICIYRTYKKYGEDFAQDLPSQIARIFLNIMDSPEALAIVESAANNDKRPHWKKLLSYCVNGNLQATFDEYAHLLTNELGSSKGLVERLHNAIAESVRLKTASYRVDTFDRFKERVTTDNNRPLRSLRTHFAVAFVDSDDEEKDADRKKAVRNAFNSPFRPFVVASTSIGQEGLDFHNYCRRIVHWNLPSNPIDLEQREGRINRFECLVVRQNIAKRYGEGPFKGNVWKELFEKAATKEKGKDVSDLIPYWGLTKTNDMLKIERIFPMYPFGKDKMAYERMCKILSLYRLTLGQPRQEEMLQHVFSKWDSPEKLKELFINLSPYYKKPQSPKGETNSASEENT